MDSVESSEAGGAPGAPTVAPTSTAAAGGEWAVDAASVKRFSQTFAEACAAQGEGVDRLGKAEAGAVLTMSGLPTETLLQIWSLADVDGDGVLDRREYLICCWLVQRSVQKQLPPPASLPAQLLESATAAVAPAPAGAVVQAPRTHASAAGAAAAWQGTQLRLCAAALDSLKRELARERAAASAAREEARRSDGVAEQARRGHDLARSPPVHLRTVLSLRPRRRWA